MFDCRTNRPFGVRWRILAVSKPFFQINTRASSPLQASYGVRILYSLQGGFNGASRGTGNFRSSVLQYWGLQIPLVGIAAILLGTGVVPVFGAIAASHVLSTFVLAAYYHLQRDGMFREASDLVAEASAD